MQYLYQNGMLTGIDNSKTEYRKYIPELTEDIVRNTIAKIGVRVKIQAIVDVVMGRYELIQK